MTAFPKDQRVRLKGRHMEALRLSCYLRDGGKCCICGCDLSLTGEHPVWPPMHMAHIKSRGAGGSDVIGNVRSLCPRDHLITEHNPKSVPPKERTA